MQNMKGNYNSTPNKIEGRKSDLSIPYLLNTDTIPIAELAQKEELEYKIPKHDKDYSYFSQLEKKGIYLNRNQIEAVKHFKGALLINAGAGSGKTSVLVSKVGYLIKQKSVKDGQVLLITFTNKAAGEMFSRLKRLPGMTMEIVQNISIGTFHSIFLEILQSYGYEIKILNSERKKESIIKVLLKEMKLDKKYSPRELLMLFSTFKNDIMNQFSDDEIVNEEILGIYEGYEKYKRERDYFDFDDVLYQTYLLLLKSETVRKELKIRFPFVLIDEFQDTNKLQFEIIKLIAPENICVVGDQDQSIYQFRGASGEIFEEFYKYFPSADTITLDINYRSTSQIVGLGNQVIRHNHFRIPKTLKATKTGIYSPIYFRPNDMEEEAKTIVQNIKSDVQSGLRNYRDFAILSRTNEYSHAIKKHFLLHEIPFVSYQENNLLFEEPLVNQILDFMRLALDPNNLEAIFGMLKSVGLNQHRLINYLLCNETNYPDFSFLDILLEAPELKLFGLKRIENCIQLIKNIEKLSPSTAIYHIRNEIKNLYPLNPDSTDDEMELSITDILINELETFSVRFNSLELFLGYIDDLKRTNDKNLELIEDTESNGVSLMTIHKAKGLQFKAIYLIGAIESVLPHQAAINAESLENGEQNFLKHKTGIEEERRLAYVAITRAIEELNISSPENYRGKNVHISRFIIEAFGE